MLHAGAFVHRNGGGPRMTSRILEKLIPALFLLYAPLCGAAEPSKLDSANTAWMLMSSMLVLFMTLPGLALFYAGLVRSKNVLSVLMQCFAITCVVTLAWVVCGYSMAFGAAGDGVCFLEADFMKQFLDVDDSLGVFPGNRVAGLIGRMLTDTGGTTRTARV